MRHGLLGGATLGAMLALSLGVAAPAWSAASPSLGAPAREAIELNGESLVDAINESDDAARRATLGEIFSAEVLERVGMDRVAGQMASIRDRFGPLDFHHAELTEGGSAAQRRLVLHVYAMSGKTGRWHDLQVRVEPEAPHLLQQLSFIAEVSEPVYLPNGAITDAETLAWLDDYISGLVEKERLSGSVLLALGDRVVYERCFGFADAAEKIPVTAATRFNLGSGNKMFTALAVMLLEGEGKLQLDTPIASYFPSFPDQAAAHAITIAHLLSHTSGVGEYWNEDTAEAVRAAGSASDLLPLVYRAGVVFDPGERYEYSNSNFVLAGLIVEKVSGRPYDEFVRERITGPLGMADTDTFPNDGGVGDLAERLTRGEQGWKALPHFNRGGPAGGGFSTARDILTFARALKAGRIVPVEVVERMTTSHTPAASRDPGSDYGYGFILSRSGDQGCYGHGGIASGVNFEFRHYPGIDATLISFSNQDNGAYDDLRRTAEKLLTGAR